MSVRLQVGYCMFSACGFETEDAVRQAREYCQQQGLTAEDAKIVKREDCVVVLLKKERLLRCADGSGGASGHR
jgi:hypothetical protein